MTKTEQLREKIGKSFDHYATAFEVDGRYSPKQWVEEVLEACQEAGLAFVAKDAELPLDPYKEIITIFEGLKDSRKASHAGYLRGQQDMLRAKFRQFKEIKVS